VPMDTQRAASRLWGAISYEPAVACRHPAVQSWREQPAQFFELLYGPAAALEHTQLYAKPQTSDVSIRFSATIIKNHENNDTSRHKPHWKMNSYTVLWQRTALWPQQSCAGIQECVHTHENWLSHTMWVGFPGAHSAALVPLEIPSKPWLIRVRLLVPAPPA
jgi:hypothetical protein